MDGRRGKKIRVIYDAGRFNSQLQSVDGNTRVVLRCLAVPHNRYKVVFHGDEVYTGEFWLGTSALPYTLTIHDEDQAFQVLATLLGADPRRGASFTLILADVGTLCAVGVSRVPST